MCKQRPLAHDLTIVISRSRTSYVKYFRISASFAALVRAPFNYAMRLVRGRISRQRPQCPPDPNEAPFGKPNLVAGFDFEPYLNQLITEPVGRVQRVVRGRQ